MATETVQHLINDELQDYSGAQKEPVDSGDADDHEGQTLASVRPIYPQSTNPFLITTDRPEEKELQTPPPEHRIDDFELARTLGTGKRARRSSSRLDSFGI